MMMKQMIGSLFVLLIGFFPFGILQMNAAPSAFLHKQQVTVYTGDSLWSIASRHTEDGEDVRNVIERIIDANKLDRKAALQPGQKLIIPVRGDKDQKLAEDPQSTFGTALSSGCGTYCTCSVL